MSRLKKLKEKIRKNIIKIATCGLALSLAIGSAQGLGTYALFTDTEDVASELVISTGDLDIKEYLKESENEENTTSLSVFEGDLIKYEEEKSKSFEIKNEGTLKQELRIGLSTDGSGLSNSILEDIDYTLTINKANKKLIDITVNFKEIKDGIKNEGSKSIDLKNIDLGDILKPGEILTFSQKISLKGSSNKVSTLTNINFDLNILATQIGYKNNNAGFFDSYNQTNYFTIGESITGQLFASYSNIFTKEQINITPYINIKEVIGGTGAFNEFEKLKIETKWLLIIPYKSIKKDDGGKFNIGNNYDSTLTVKVNNNGKEQYWKIYFTYYKNFDLRAYYQVIEKPITLEEEIEISSEPEVIEPSKEEVEIQSEAEAIEPPKEEVKIPNEPDVIEPPKVEEEVELIEPEVIESSKEEVEVPSESDVVVSNQMDIVAQKKEEDVE